MWLADEPVSLSLQGTTYRELLGNLGQGIAADAGGDLEVGIALGRQEVGQSSNSLLDRGGRGEDCEGEEDGGLEEHGWMVESEWPM